MLRFIMKYGLVLLLASISATTAFCAPPGIADLAAGIPTVSSIPLSWSVGSGGPATAYELRYSTAPIDAGNFPSAVPLGGVAAPTGGAEGHTVSGLACGTAYWFAVMAYDAAKSGGLSNIVSAVTAACTPAFAEAGNYALPGSPHASVTGDFNNDGKPDLAFGIFSNTGSNYVSVMLGNGGGTFLPAVNYETGYEAGTYFLATGDLNGDGRLDLVAANWLAGNISIFIGNGDGTFQAAAYTSLAQGVSSIATGDFNGDGKLDLAVTIQDQSEIRIFPGNGDGTFGSAATYSTDHPMMVVVRDFNRDGKEDLAVTNLVNGTVSIRLGIGDGSFPVATTFGTGAGPLGIVAQDINGDGRLDLLVSRSEGDGSVYILKGIGNGTFQPYTTHQGGDSTSRYVTLSDLNGDGIADLIDSGSFVYVSVGNGDGTFKPAVNFSAGTSPIRTVLIGDFDDDGKADMATANYGGNNASILLNNSTWSPAGSFMAAPSLATGTNPSSVKTADLNGDGRLDLVTSNEGGANADVFYGNGDGTFQTAVTLSAGFSPDALTIADFNRDGRPDLLLINDSSSVYRYDNSGSGFSGPAQLAFGINNDDVTSADVNRDGIPDLVLVYNNTTAYSWAAVHLGDGAGGFGAETAYTAGSYANSVTAGDFNRDGITDLATGNFNGNDVSILLGKSDGAFHAAVNYGTGANPVTLATADFNGDGKPDLAVPNYGGTTVSVLLGNGDGTFQAKTDYTAGGSPQTVVVGDIDRDGKRDLVVASRGGSFISILRGRGDGSFLPAEDITVGSSPIYPALGDFNGDGKPDIAVANYNSSTLSILLNTAPLPTAPQQGLVALWRAENNALDSIGGNHGTLQGGATYAAGKFGQAFSLDGEDDYIEIPNSPSLNPAAAITVEAWYLPVSFAGNGNNAIVSKGYSSPSEPYYEYHLGVNGDQYSSPNSRPGSFSFSVSPNYSRVYVETDANTWVPGNWYHLVGTYDGTEIRLYVNGVLQASAPATGTLNDYGKSVRIGAFNNISSNNIDYTPGLIDEVAIHSRALPAMEIAAISAMAPNPFSFNPQTGMPLSTTIVSNPITVTGITNAAAISITGGAYAVSTDGGSSWNGWTGASGTVSLNDQVKVSVTSSATPLSQTDANLTIGGVSGTFSVTTAAATDPNASGLVSWWRGESNAYDSVGGNHGTLQNGATFAAGQVGQAFSFDGVNDYVNVSPGSEFNFGSANFTINLWVNFNNLGGEQVLIEKFAGSTGPGWTLTKLTDNKIRFYVSGSAFFDVTPASLSDGAWNNLTVIRESGMTTICWNGTSIGNHTIPDSIQSGSSLRLGSRGGTDYFLNGQMDEVKIFNRALTSSEVSKLAGTYPDAFSFTPITGVIPSQTVDSLESITVTGITQAAPISISTGGEYELNGSGTWLSNPSTVNLGDTVKVHLTSSSSFGTTTTATLTIGGVNGTFSVTTLADTENPLVTGFSIAVTEATNMSIGVTSVTATDNSGIVSGYLITTSSTHPSSSDPAWSVNPPTTFILPMAGTNTLYAWAKDPAGNVSDPATATVTLMPVRRDPAPYNYYDSINAACSTASGGETIKALAVSVPGSVTISGKSLTIKGGHADGYGSQSGVTVLQGTLTIGTGSLVVDRLAVR